MEFSKQLKDLIEIAIEDGKLDEKEKDVLFKRAQSEGVSSDEFEMYLNSRLNEIQKKQEKKRKYIRNIKFGCIIYLLFFVAMGILMIYIEEKEDDKNYGSSYEKACENGDFAVAHNILEKLKEDVLYVKKFEDDHQIKKEKKTHWFKDDEIVDDPISVQDHLQYIADLQYKGRNYLAGLDYVYNAEIAYVREANEDDSSEKVNHLLSELKSKLLLFKSLDMEDEAQKVYNKLAQKAGVATNEGADDSDQTP